LWNRATGEEVFAMHALGGSVGAVAFSRNGHRIASATGEGLVHVWDGTPLPSDSTAAGHQAGDSAARPTGASTPPDVASEIPRRREEIHALQMHILEGEYSERAEYEKAEPLAPQAVDAARRVFGAEAGETLIAMNNLAFLYKNQNRFVKAESLYTQTLAIQRRVCGPSHAETLRTMHNLAALYRDWGDYAKAEVLGREALASARGKQGGDHADIAQLMALVGSILLKQQKYAEAEPILREGLAICANVTPDAWGRFYTESLLGESLLGQCRYAEAEPLLLAGYEGLKARELKLAAYHRVYLTEAGERIVRLYEARGQPDKSAMWKKKLGLNDLPADPFAGP
jgi:hypothetical protein